MDKKLTHVAWLVLAGALLLRLAGLGHAPLAPAEAARALAALDVVQGAAWSSTGDSPLLLMDNVAGFTLFGAHNVVARLLPALAGAVLVALPLLWRKRLGAVGVVVAMVTLACSPLLLFATRRVEGTMLGVLGAALILSLLFDEDRETVEVYRVWLLAAGVALGLMGSPAFFDVLLPGMLAWWLSRRLLDAPVVEVLRPWLTPALWGLGGALLVALGFGLRLNGWGTLGQTFAAWLATWHGTRQVSGTALLLLYEPFALLLAFVALGLSIVRRDATALSLSVWAAATLVLLGLRPGVAPTLWGAVVVPLALLAGWAVQTLVAEVAADVRPWLWRHAVVGLVFWLPVGLALGGHANNTLLVARPIVLVLGAVVLLALHVLVALIFAYVVPSNFVWRGVLLGIAATLLLMQFSFAWGGAFVRPTSSAELATLIATSEDLNALVDALDEVAVRTQKRRDTLSIALVEGDVDFTPTLRWVLRDFSQVTLVAGWSLRDYDVVISPETVRPPLGDMPHSVGMRFTALLRSEKRVPLCQTLVPLECRDWARWYLFRQVPAGWETSESALLWKIP